MRNLTCLLHIISVSIHLPIVKSNPEQIFVIVLPGVGMNLVVLNLWQDINILIPE